LFIIKAPELNVLAFLVWNTQCRMPASTARGARDAAGEICSIPADVEQNNTQA
jgi:hypothetical protein